MAKVLLVDDNQTMISLLTTLLSMEDHEVATLLDMTGDMLENVRNEMPDILIIDVNLGDRNGLDIVREIRQAPELNKIKVIMISGEDRTDDCLAAGADAFLLKPFMPDELIKKLRD